MEVHTRNECTFGPPLQHQVFLNFRGVELRYGFVSHLVEALHRHGINGFIDSLESKGEDLTNLFTRIEESAIALVIFSRRYTESVWCLDELAKIKERADQGLLKVIPIFYKVEPVAVKQLRGVFGDKFRVREWEYGCDKPRTDRWKDALASISSKIGLTLDKKSDESKFVRIIIKEVEKMLLRKENFAVIPFSGGQRMNILALSQDKLDLSRESVLVHENSCIANQIVAVSKSYMDIKSENNVLRAQLVELSERLHSLNSTIEMSEGAIGEVHTHPDFLINPCSSMAIG
ncbi:hypothetical protein Bca101_064436 [Brassica carinata]